MCIIRDITNCIKGGYLAVIIGYDMDRAESVMFEALTDSHNY